MTFNMENQTTTSRKEILPAVPYIEKVCGDLPPTKDMVFAVPVMDDYDALVLLIEDLVSATKANLPADIGLLVCVNSPLPTKENTKTVAMLEQLSKQDLPISLAWIDLQNGECLKKQGTARSIMFNILAATLTDPDSVLVAMDADCRIAPVFVQKAMEQDCDLYNFDLGYHGAYVKEYEYYNRWFRYNREFWRLAGSPSWWVRQKCPGICFRVSVLGKVPNDVWDMANAEHIRFLDYCQMAGMTLKTIEAEGAITADTRLETRISGGMSDDVIKATKGQYLPVPHPKAALAIRKILVSGMGTIRNYMEQTRLFGSTIPPDSYVTLDEAEAALAELKAKVMANFPKTFGK